MNNPASPASAEAYLLQVRHVSRVFSDGQVSALVDVSLSIRRGEYAAIVGPSGSGKSTLLNLLGALDRPTHGEVLFGGRSLSAIRDIDSLRACQIGFVFQSFHLLPTLSALENVQIPMFEGPRRSPSERIRKAQELLTIVGLARRMHHLPSQMSVGERQRTAIARALANDPPLILADEPTGNLDSHSGSAILDLFDSLHRERHVTLVVITHSSDVAQRAERIITLHDGRLASDNESGRELLHLQGHVPAVSNSTST
jgi:putative ABC transport system ATP-binding protein